MLMITIVGLDTKVLLHRADFLYTSARDLLWTDKCLKVTVLSRFIGSTAKAPVSLYHCRLNNVISFHFCIPPVNLYPFYLLLWSVLLTWQTVLKVGWVDAYLLNETERQRGPSVLVLAPPAPGLLGTSHRPKIALWVTCVEAKQGGHPHEEVLKFRMVLLFFFQQSLDKGRDT